MTAPKAPPPDRAAREAAIHERQLNVVIDAGAGTGKTSTLVERWMALVAPMNDATQPMRADRIVAVTFTRRAAGELRLRMCERLLAELSVATIATARSARLRSALGSLDTAYIGTIHSFADRLLRLRPVEASLSPSYEIAEDDSALVQGTFERLVKAAETHTLERELGGSPAQGRAAEAEATVLDALRAGIPAQSRSFDFVTAHGLEGLIAAFVRGRDAPPADPDVKDFDVAAYRKGHRDLQDLVGNLDGSSAGARWLVQLARRFPPGPAPTDPVALYAELYPAVHSLGQQSTLKDTFDGDAAAWQAWQLFLKGSHKKVSRDQPLRDELLAPFQRWLANRLVRLFPVVVALYDRVKARHRVVDSIDLLLELRNLLGRDTKARAYYQSLFDHIFVDEFQDTDPLQADILLYLCERTPTATRAADVELARGKLTLVGDPKQSIYRFRRADIAMYESVRRKVAESPHRALRLSANFRSTPPLIEWFNDRFAAMLGGVTEGVPTFSPITGEVAYEPLARGRADGQDVAIHVLSFDQEEAKTSVGAYRALEAEALARYLRWLIEQSGVEVLDGLTRARRPVTYGDVAVLALATTNLPLLFPQLDAMGVPHAARGGTLFLQDPLHRQFLLGLRAIADRDDGVAQAALFRAPFFAIDVGDVATKTPAYEDAARIVRDLRARRGSRPAGDTARDLLEGTAFGRAVALGPNGAQRLERLRELCLLVEQTAARDGLDLDGATAILRRLAIDPAQLDPPHPVGEDAVQILTVHQAKGLEFPVVVLWDGRAGIEAQLDHQPWHVARTDPRADARPAWHLAIDRLTWEEPSGAALRDKEKRYCTAERKRLVYVAATRARDLLVVPRAGAPTDKHVAGLLLAGEHDPMALELQTYRADKLPVWAEAVRAPAPRVIAGAPNEDAVRIEEAWRGALEEAARPRLAPRGVTTGARVIEGEEVRTRRGRFGPVFGETVHRAIGMALRAAELGTGTAETIAAHPVTRSLIERAAFATGQAERLEEAAADVGRALAALERDGLRGPGVTFRTEYPVVGVGHGEDADGSLLVGYIDLLVVTEQGCVVIDFKTDRFAGASVREDFAAYARQLERYVELLSWPARAALLFTDGGQLMWLQPKEPTTHQ